MSVCHGSLSTYHILDICGVPGLIDWDRQGYGPIEYDVANFMSTLGRLASGDPSLARSAAATEEAFLSKVEDVVHPKRLSWYRLASAFKFLHYYAHKQPHDWPDRMDGALRDLEARVNAYTAALEGPAR
jgi:hypothetical protein